MAIIRPFKAIRPNKKFAKDVAALPYDVMSSDEARQIAKNNPYSFLHVDKAEIDLDCNINVYDDRIYAKAKENFEKLVNDKVFIQDNEPCFYIYELSMNGRKQKGLVVCTSVDEYINNNIKKHELTREDKEQDRIKHVDVLNANTGPIFLAYRAVDRISEFMNNYENPIYDFVSDDGIGHKVHIIDDRKSIDNLIDLFKSVPFLYIADGHHRNASAVKVALKRRNDNPNYDPNNEFNYYLSVLFPDNELMIMDYNRLVKDLNGNDEPDFLKKLSENFIIEQSKKYKPDKAHTFGMYLNKKWYKLTFKDGVINNSDIIDCLDVSILQKLVLERILGINDVRTDKRIDFIGGIRGIDELEKKVDSGEMAVAFAMYPTSMDELFQIADANKLMPPKSTWFEPKLRSGLFVHKL